ncbi:Fumarylacetoacetate (FAA) hydrolase family protein [Maioricimonas rarisocia]|uniref:Fumarylacetoacetate (FAA) hydrolase family protein n=1 Tax=Maioricimonas rarisocia TaxID=2528026 RepID=A0A517ZFC4_9PLAN|nr:fumarylacetoacetate hydrolase family protein [Maioricimonas rarisocia]QDU41154.1 Fumarylacetoacetate (FAA) hydrolase family protein [Maioricimonas rarisocia]
MKLARVALTDGSHHVAEVVGDQVVLLELAATSGCSSLADILHTDDPAATARSARTERALPLDQVKLLAPIDQQDVWAAGVTYKRSQVARMEESEHGASHYDRVYSADRPELFFKATPSRVSGPDEPVRVRADSEWSVPEPEFTLVINPAGKIVGYTIGNDMSARDIEGENPLYLPQAKVYRQCAGLGPVILLATDPLDLAATTIRLTIEREGSTAFEGNTSLEQLNRKLEDLAGWLYREDAFPEGAFLMTGTGIVPADDFTLQAGDVISIEVAGIGTLTNPVVCG